MLSFVKRVLSGFHISSTETQVGVITFDSHPYLQFYFNKYHTKAAVTNAVSGTRLAYRFICLHPFSEEQNIYVLKPIKTRGL